MYFLYKEHAHAGSYYISKKPYNKNIKEREGFCEQCYTKMLEIREMKGQEGGAYENKKLWSDYEIPYYDIQLGYVEETEDSLSKLQSLMVQNIQKYIQKTVQTFTITKDEVDAEIEKTGKFYLNFSITM